MLMTILPDLLDYQLKLIFCGTAASDISAREQAYYANPNNYFWRTLAQVGLTPNLLQPRQYSYLLQYRIGLTDLAKNAQGVDAKLHQSDFDVHNFLDKMARYQPRVIAFTSKKGASVVLDKPTRSLQYGLQVERVEHSQVWVLPSPSGAARSYWDESVWQALADYVHQL